MVLKLKVSLHLSKISVLVFVDGKENLVKISFKDHPNITGAQKKYLTY